MIVMNYMISLTMKKKKTTPDEEVALNLYRQLDEGDKGEIRGEMKGMLTADKYDTIKKELRNA